jgi:hypothetical protein
LCEDDFVLAALKSMGLVGWILKLKVDSHGLAARDRSVLGPMNMILSIIIRMYPDVDVLC